MHYRAKEFPLQNLTADADALMRELNRAMSAVDGHIDQNNLKDGELGYKLVRAAHGEAATRSTSLAGTELTQAGGAQLYGDVQQAVEMTLEPAKDQYSGDDDEAKKNLTWEHIEVTPTAANPSQMEISLEATETTYLHIFINGQVEVGQSTAAAALGRLSEYEVRILLNNTPLDSYGSFPCKCNGGFMPFHVEARATVTPGAVSIRAQIRDKSSSPADGSAAADIALKLTNTYMYCYGHTR